MRGPSIKRSFIFIIILVLIVWCYIFLHDRPSSLRTAKPWEIMEEVKEYAKPYLGHSTPRTNHIFDVTNTTVEENKPRAVLIFTEYEGSKFLKKLSVALESQRISYDILTWNRFGDVHLSLPRLDAHGVEQYSGFIFDNVKIYDMLDAWTKSLLHDFCRSRNIGIVLLCALDYKKEADYVQLNSLPLWVKHSVKGLYDVELNPKSPVLQITKAGQVLKYQHRAKHTVLWSNHSGYEPVSFSYRDDTPIENNFALEDTPDGTNHQGNVYRVNRSKFITIMYDKGEYDGIRRVFFGGRIDSLWLYRMVFLDALSVVSKGVLGRPLTQWIMIDIDDIFVAHSGTRMKREDVEVT